MTALTTGYSAAVLRTDFSDQQMWDEISTQITAGGTGDEDGFPANAYLVDNVAYEKATVADILDLTPRPGYNHQLVIVVDAAAITDPDHAVLVLSVFGDERGQSFRSLPGRIQSVENNLFLSNMDWHEFAGSVDSNGIFRGF